MNTQTLFPPFFRSPHLHLPFLSVPIASSYALHPSEIIRKNSIFYLFYHRVTLTTKSRNRMLPPQKPPLAPYPEITATLTSAIIDFVDSLWLRKFPSISICITNVYNLSNGFLCEIILILFLPYLLMC